VACPSMARPSRLDNASIVVHGQDQCGKISRQHSALEVMFIWLLLDYQHDSSRQPRVLRALHVMPGPVVLAPAAAWLKQIRLQLASELQLRYRCKKKSGGRVATLCGCTTVDPFLVSGLWLSRRLQVSQPMSQRIQQRGKQCLQGQAIRCLGSCGSPSCS
jgi:hypothetical protein